MESYRALCRSSILSSANISLFFLAAPLVKGDTQPCVIVVSIARLENRNPAVGLCVEAVGKRCRGYGYGWKFQRWRRVADRREISEPLDWCSNHDCKILGDVTRLAVLVLLRAVVLLLRSFFATFRLFIWHDDRVDVRNL